jgi:diacylglycerol O-acyltransferase
MTRPIPPLDLAFLWIDRPETPANVGAVLVLDPVRGRSVAAAARRIVKAYRAARPTSPFDRVPDLSGMGLPHWRTVDTFDPRRHVRHLHLPAPGSAAQFRERIARLHESPLDRRYPLFEVYVIDGLATNQLAVYFKTHHATWDGRYALRRVFGNLEQTPGPIVPPFFAIPAPDQASRETSDTHTSPIAAGARLLLTQASALRELFGVLSAQSSPAGSPAATPGNRPFAGPHTRFNGPVGAGRSFASFSLPLDRMRRVARRLQTTLNDVALAVVDGGVESYLAGLGERPERPLVAMCPVSQRAAGDNEATTKVATLFVPLAAPRSGASRRLTQIAEHARAAKSEFRGFSREAAFDYALLAFGLWFASSSLGLRAVTRPVINLVVSNVGGVDGPRYLGEHRIAGAYPVSMLADVAGLNVTLMSLDDRMDFGLIAESVAVPDAGELAAACLAMFERLSRARPRSVGLRQRRVPPRQSAVRA